MGDASLAAAAAQAGLSAEELRELLDRDAQLAAASPAKRQRGLDGGSCSSGGGGSDLPPGWVEAKDARYNDKTYWYNKTTRSTSWTKPEWPPQPQPQPQRQWCDPTGLRQPQMQGALSPGRAGHGGGQADRNYGPSYGAVATQPPRAGYTPQRGAGYGGVVPQSGPRIETMLDAWVAARADKYPCVPLPCAVRLRREAACPGGPSPISLGLTVRLAYHGATLTPNPAPPNPTPPNQVAAKRGKDFATADTLRSELRAAGVDPDTERPGHTTVRSQQGRPKVPSIVKLLPGDP